MAKFVLGDGKNEWLSIILAQVSRRQAALGFIGARGRHGDQLLGKICHQIAFTAHFAIFHLHHPHKLCKFVLASPPMRRQTNRWASSEEHHF